MMISPRTEERVTINKEFENVEIFINEYVTNISRNGVFIRSENPLAVGTEINLNVTVIMDEIETIKGQGEVVRVEGNPSGMGVVFTKLDKYSDAIIERLLTKQSNRV